jgi:hypothetical protein
MSCGPIGSGEFKEKTPSAGNIARVLILAVDSFVAGR